MFFMLIRLLQSGLIKGTLQSFPVILIKYWLVFANLCRKYNRKPAMQTFYNISCWLGSLSHNFHPPCGIEII